MKLRGKHIIMVAPGILLLVIISLQYLYPYIFKHHAQKVDSDYFIIACVVCGTMPFIFTLLYIVYNYFQQLKEKQQAEEDEKFLSDYINGRK